MFPSSPRAVLRVMIGSSVVGTYPIGAIRLCAERLAPGAEFDKMQPKPASQRQSRCTAVTCVIWASLYNVLAFDPRMDLKW